MKIASANWNIAQTENLYKNITQKLSVKPETERQSQDREISGETIDDSKAISTKSILTDPNTHWGLKFIIYYGIYFSIFIAFSVFISLVVGLAIFLWSLNV